MFGSQQSQSKPGQTLQSLGVNPRHKSRRSPAASKRREKQHWKSASKSVSQSVSYSIYVDICSLMCCCCCLSMQTLGDERPIVHRHTHTSIRQIAHFKLGIRINNIHITITIWIISKDDDQGSRWLPASLTDGVGEGCWEEKTELKSDSKSWDGE